MAREAFTGPSSSTVDSSPGTPAGSKPMFSSPSSRSGLENIGTTVEVCVGASAVHWFQ